MRLRSFLIPSLLLMFVFMSADETTAARRNYTVQGLQSSEIKQSQPKVQNNLPGKPYDELVKDKVVIEGLFTFYLDTIENSLLMAVKPEQFGPVFLCGETMSQSESRYSDNRSMRRTFPFYFQRVGKSIMFMEKNLRLRADSSLPVSAAIESALSDHLYASAEIKSQPHEETGAILVDPADFFLQDAPNIG